MSDSKCWQVIQACGASREEIKVQREVFAVAVDTNNISRAKDLLAGDNVELQEI